MPGPSEAREAEELRRALAGFATLTSPIATPLKKGLIHQTYAVEDASGSFILQHINPIFSPRINDNIVCVSNHLRRKGIASLSLESSREGKPFLELEGGSLWRLMSRIAGTSFDRCPDAAHAREAGRHVSTFHGALADFEQPMHPLGIPFHDTARHHADLRAALDRHTDHPLHREVARLAASIAETDPRARIAPDVPARVIHGDLKFNNLLFAEETGGAGGISPAPRTAGLIDLDTLSRMPLCFDWGDAWRSWCNPRGEDDPVANLDLDLFDAATEGLMEALAIQPERSELESLSWGLELLSLETCVRFAADALEERYFAWNPERFESAGAHNLARARGQFSLYEQARDTHEARARLILR